jgi:hypothetical protein
VGSQDKDHKAQHQEISHESRRHLFDLFGFFSLGASIVLFRAVHVREPTKGKCQGFRWAQHVSV